MKYFILTFILFFVQFGNAQNHLAPIVFNGLEPNWQSFIVDSTTLSDPKKLGINHLTTNFILVKESEEIAYFIYWDFSDRFQGAFIQKRNVKTGEVFWTNLYNKSNSERHEFPRSARLDNDGNLVIVNLRNNDPNYTPDTGIAWTKASPSYRVYNKNNGELINQHFSVEPINKDNEIIFYTGFSNIMTVDQNMDIYYITTKYTNELFETSLKLYDEKCNYRNIINDTFLNFKSNFNYSNFDLLHSNKIYTYKHVHEQNPQLLYKSENFNKYNYTSEIYSENYTNKSQFDLTGRFPYNWKINFSGDNGEEFWLICGDSTNIDQFTSKSSKALVFINQETGEVGEIIDFGNNKYERIYAIKKPSSKSAIIITQDYIEKKDPITQEYISEITFWETDGIGNLKKLKSLKYSDSRTLTISSANLIGDNIVLGTYMRTYANPNLLTPTHQVKGLLGFDYDFITSTEEIDRTRRLNIYPNPTDGFIKINNLEISSKVNVYNLSGVLIKSYTDITKQINIHDLPSGIFILEILNEQIKERYKIVKIE